MFLQLLSMLTYSNLSLPCDDIYPPLHQALHKDPINLEAAKLTVQRAIEIYPSNSIAAVTEQLLENATPLYR